MTGFWDEEKMLRRQGREQFELKSRLPGVWMSQAGLLWRSAEILHTHISEAEATYTEMIKEEILSGRFGNTGSRDMTQEESDVHRTMALRGVYHMLCGMAIENILKAILVSQGPTNVLKGGKFQYNTHDLVKLLGLCGLVGSDSERDLLLDLSEYIEWRGRYCIPLTQEGNKPVRRHSGEAVEPDKRVKGNKYEETNALFEKLWQVAQQRRGLSQD